MRTTAPLGRHRLFLFVFAIALAATLLTLFAKGIPHALVLSAIIGLLLLMTSRIWLPEGYGRTTVRLVSLTVAASAALSFGLWELFLESVVHHFLEAHFPDLAPAARVSPALVFGFLATVIWVVNRDSTAMGIHPRNVEEDIPEPKYREKQQAVCKALSRNLHAIDIDTNWSMEYFTPLDADVSARTGTGITRRRKDLMHALRRARERMVLVLGDPGAGKSVALRNLCQQLTGEVAKTGKIPIYVNLREWVPADAWSDTRPPTVEQLRDFVKENVRGRDIVTSSFFKAYFDKLYTAGRLYFVLDSFDEIPSVRNERHDSALIDELSAVIFNFLDGSGLIGAQGILASRFFRKPSHHFRSSTEIEVLPFSEHKLLDSLRQRGMLDEVLIKELVTQRPELMAVARAPFVGTLLSAYVEEHQALPPSQARLYESYISATLALVRDRMEKKELTAPDVMDCCVAVARNMYASHGLEATIGDLAEALPSEPVADVIDILKFARLGRGVAGDESRFSFVHRRFAEYFVVLGLLQEEEVPYREAIPTDSQWRDALVLYCEVTDDARARAIAEFCWESMRKAQDPSDLSAIHAMRFLRDAYRGRVSCITFHDELARFVDSEIHRRNKTLRVKYAVETIGLLPESAMKPCILKALSLSNALIEEPAIRSCRHLSRLGTALRSTLTRLVTRISPLELLGRRKQLRVTFGLSDAFRPVQRMLDARTWNVAASMSGSIVLAALYPRLLPYTVTAALLCTGFSAVRRTRDLQSIQATAKRLAFPWYALVSGGVISLLLLAEDLLYLAGMPEYSSYSRALGGALWWGALVAVGSLVPWYFLVSAAEELATRPTRLRPWLRSNLHKLAESLRDAWVLLLLPGLGVALFWLLRRAGIPPEQFLGVTGLAFCLFFLVWSLKQRRHFESIWMAIGSPALMLVWSIVMVLLSSDSVRLTVMTAVEQVFVVLGVESWLKLVVILIGVCLLIAILHAELSIRYEWSCIRLGTLTRRETIWNTLVNLKSSRNRARLLSYLESHVPAVEGEWPDGCALQIDSSEWEQQLVRLEERWLGLDR